MKTVEYYTWMEALAYDVQSEYDAEVILTADENSYVFPTKHNKITDRWSKHHQETNFTYYYMRSDMFVECLRMQRIHILYG